MFMGPGTSASSRYNYNVRLFSEDGDKIRISIIAKVEVMVSHSTGGGNFKDATQENKATAKDLETWLYEQIEKAL
jgi:hypothetical protein